MHLPAVIFSLFLLSSLAFADQKALNQELYDAVLYNDPAAASAALAKGANVNHKVNERSVLGWAAQRGNADVVGALLGGGADPNTVDGVGNTPLMRGIETRHAAVVRQLLEAGADTDRRDTYGRLLVNLAVEADNAQIVEALLEAGADFNVTDDEGNSPALLAVMGEGEAMYDTLGAFGHHGVDMNLGNPSYTPLYYAVEQGNVEMARALLEAGADPSLATDDGYLPLVPALSNKEMLDVLLAAGADPNGLDANGDPVLFEALFAVSAEAAEALIAAGADVNKPGADGRTPLTRANDGGDQETADLLRRHGATGDQAPEIAARAEEAVVVTGPTDDEFPRVADLPVYPGAETLYTSEEDHSVMYATPDPVPLVAKVTTKLLEKAGWVDDAHPHTTREKDRYYVIFSRERYQLIFDVAIARAMSNQTMILYSIPETGIPR